MMGLLWTATSLMAFFGLMFLSWAGKNNEGSWGERLMYAVIFIGPLVAQIWFVIWRSGNRTKTHAYAMGEGGVPLSQGFDHSEGDSGIGLNASAKTITLRNGGFWKTYPFSEVREWSTVSETSGAAIGVGVQGSLQALGASVQAARAAEAASGLFIQVRDVDNAKWRIQMKDPSTQSRWMELLRQQLNES